MSKYNIFDAIGTKEGINGGDKNICPVVAVINKIGGRYEDDSTEIISQVKIGGNLYSFNDVDLFCDDFALTIARLKIRQTSREKLRLHWRKIGQPIIEIGRTSELIMYILSKTEVFNMIYRMLKALHKKIGRLNDTIVMSAYHAAKKGKCLDMKLPHYYVPFNENINDTLEVCNDYLRDLNISCIAKYNKYKSHHFTNPITFERDEKIELSDSDDYQKSFEEIATIIEGLRDDAKKEEANFIKYLQKGQLMIDFIDDFKFLY